MPPMKIQPIDCETTRGSSRNDQVKPLVKSRFKRLFEWQFSKISSVETPCGDDFEPNSVCLAKMVQNFLEENNDKHSLPVKCNRNRCNCFNGTCSDNSDDEYYFCRRSSDSVSTGASSEASEVLKRLVSCASNAERVLLADTTKIVERNKISNCNCKRKDDCRKTVIEGLLLLGYDASICKSRWEKTTAYPAGEYEYIDVFIEGERLLIDIDFKSEFEVARSTGTYRSILQSLPTIFVGKADRLEQLVSIVSDAAKQSLKKKGMYIPPWRKAEYMRSKWLSPYTRTTTNSIEPVRKTCAIKTKSFSGEFEFIFKEKPSVLPEKSVEEEKITVVVTPWMTPKSSQKGFKIVAGLASVLKDNP